MKLEVCSKIKISLTDAAQVYGRTENGVSGCSDIPPTSGDRKPCPSSPPGLALQPAAAEQDDPHHKAEECRGVGSLCSVHQVF